jgi:hypothetical protein
LEIETMRKLANVDWNLLSARLVRSDAGNDTREYISPSDGREGGRDDVNQPIEDVLDLYLGPVGERRDAHR